MRATELFAILAFIKSLERIYLTPGFTPSSAGSGAVSVPPVLLNIISDDFSGTSVQVPALPSVPAPVQVDSMVSVATIINAPTCISYISLIARPRFSPALVIPPRPQPTCLNRRLLPKFESSGPKSLWIIPSPFLSPPNSILPNAPFCFSTDQPDVESEIDNDSKIEIEKDTESIWLSLLLSPTFLAIVWNFCHLLVRRPIRSPTVHFEPVDNQTADILLWSQPNHVVPKCKKVEHRDRVTQPRVFISTLPSLPAGFDTFIVMHQRPAECNTLPTGYIPALPPPTTIETSPSPHCTATSVAVVFLEKALPLAELTTSAYAPSPVSPSSAGSSPDESVIAHPPTPTLHAVLIPPLMPEEFQSSLESSCWAPTPKPAPAKSSDAPESSSPLPACKDAIDNATRLSTPTPTLVKKKRVRTRGPKHLRILKTTVETTTQESSSQATTTTETRSNSLSDSIWAHKAAGTALENDLAPINPTDVSNVEVRNSAMASTETVVDISSKPTSSLSDSIWASKLRGATSENDDVPVTCPHMEERVLGLQDSMWAAASDVPTSSQLTCDSKNSCSSLPTPTPTPAKERGYTKGLKHVPIIEIWTVQPATYECSEAQDLSSSTSISTIETPSSEVSFLFSESISAPESTENAPPPDMPSHEDKASGLQNSIWATTPAVPEVPEVVASSDALSTSFNPPEILASTLAFDNIGEASTSLSAPMAVKKKRVRTRGSKHSRIQSTQQTQIQIPTTIVEVLQSTTAVEIPLESPSSLSVSIWAPGPSETIAAYNTPLRGEEKASGLQASIWATEFDVEGIVVLPATLPTPPPSAKKTSSLTASIWADDTPTTATCESAPVVICEEDLFACEQRNDSVGASRWANAPDTPSTPRPSAGRGGVNRWRGRRGRGPSRA